jgi:phosphoribosylglycinamide formyltransferase-1
VRVAVLVSGTGSILDAMLAEKVPVVLVLGDRPCRALEVAGGAGIDAELVDRQAYGGFGAGFDRTGFTRKVTEVLRGRDIDLVAMAGFGTVLAGPLFDAFPGRILNTHPALLPAFPGWHAVDEALASGATVTGCTVHLATVETDAGPVLAQEQVPVLAGDTVQSLHERIKQVERKLYPATVKKMIDELEVATPGRADQEVSR